MQTAYGLDTLQNHVVYHNAGSFQIDFQFSKNVEDWQLESAQKFAYDKFYLRDVAKYDLWEYDVWLIEHISEVSECVMFRIFVDDQLIMMGSYPGLNPAELKINDLPEGYYYEIDQNQNIIFTDGLQTVGGITSYPIPDGIYDPEDESFNWLKKLVIPDYEDPNLYYLAGITSGNDGWAADFADELDEAKRTVYRHHTFQVVGDTLYDIWFDRLKISFEDDFEIRKVISISQSQAQIESYTPTSSSTNIETDTQLVAYGCLKMLLPSGFAAIEDGEVVLLTKDDVAVGGIRQWDYPEFQPSDLVEWKKKELGVPIGYMSGGSAYGDMEVEVFWDGNPDGLNEEHQFFIDGDVIYDVWFDQNQISGGMAERFLKTVAIHAEPNPAFTSQELEALAKCKAVLDTVQGGSHHIAWEKFRTSSSGTLGYSVEYLSHNNDWLHITSLETGTDIEKQLRMQINGKYFYDVQSSDQKNIHWNNGNTVDKPELPWLASYLWDEATVAYVDTLQEQGLEFVMLRVDEPFYGYPEDTVCYWVNFVFDDSGRFVRVELQADAFRNNEIWSANEVESIVSLDPQIVNAEIQGKYQSIFQ